MASAAVALPPRADHLLPTPEISPLVLPCSAFGPAADSDSDSDVEDLVLPCSVLSVGIVGPGSAPGSAYDGDESAGAEGGGYNSSSSSEEEEEGEGEGEVPLSVLGGVVYASPDEYEEGNGGYGEGEGDEAEGNQAEGDDPRPPTPASVAVLTSPLAQITIVASISPAAVPSETTALLVTAATATQPQTYGATPRPSSRGKKVKKSNKRKAIFRHHRISPNLGRPARMRYGAISSGYESFPEYESWPARERCCRWFC